MSYPPGVQLATLTFSNPSTFLGGEATRSEVMVEASASVVWSATGQPIDNFEENVNPGGGLPGSLTVPFVDQAGFTDQSGNAFTNWAYVVTRRTTFGNKVKMVRKNWQPVLGQDVVDFDNLPGGPIGLSVSAPQVAVTSVAGLTAAVGAEELADVLGPFLPDATLTPESVAANLPARLEAAALDATYASGFVHFVVSDTEPTETTVDGKPVVWIDTSVPLVSVSAAAPTFNDGTDTYTIPTSTGVDYKVSTVTQSAGSYGVTAPATVTVDAVAQTGYALTGTVQWTGTFTVNTDTTAPTAPTNLAGTAGITTMDLSWTASTDALGVTGYRVSADNGSTWITSAVTGTTYQVTGLTASTAYTFAVAARDAAGNWSTNATLAKSTTAAAGFVLPPQDVTETFAYADGATLAGVTTTTGGLVWEGTGGYQGWMTSTPPTIAGGKITLGSGRVQPAQQNVATSATYSVGGTTSADKVMLYAAGPQNVNTRAAASIQIKSSSTATATATFYDAAGGLLGELTNIAKSGVVTIRNNSGSWTFEVDGVVKMGPVSVTAAAGNWTGFAIQGSNCTLDNFSVDYL